MKFSIISGALKKALAAVGMISQVRGSDVGTLVLIETGPDFIQMVRTDCSNSCVATASAETDSAGARLVLSYDDLRTVVNNLGANLRLEFELLNNSLHLQFSTPESKRKGQYTFAVGDEAGYPLLPTPDHASTLSVPISEFCAQAAALSNGFGNRLYSDLTGAVFLESFGDRLRMVAYSTPRLSIAGVIELGALASDNSCVVLLKNIVDVASQLKGVDGVVEISMGRGLVISAPGIQIMISVLDSKYPPYRNVMVDAVYPCSMMVERAALMDSLSRLTSIADFVPKLFFKIEEGALALQHAAATRSGEEAIAVDNKGSIEFYSNGRVLLDGLSAMTADVVRIDLGERFLPGGEVLNLFMMSSDSDDMVQYFAPMAK